MISANASSSALSLSSFSRFGSTWEATRIRYWRLGIFQGFLILLPWFKAIPEIAVVAEFTILAVSSE